MVGNLTVQFARFKKSENYLNYILSEYSLLEVFGFEGVMDFGEKLVKWQWNENCLKVGGGLT